MRKIDKYAIKTMNLIEKKTSYRFTYEVKNKKNFFMEMRG